MRCRIRGYLIFRLMQPHYTAGFVVEHTSVNMALPSNVSVAKESDLAKLVESGRAKPLSKKKDDESSEDSDDNTTLWEMMHRSKNKKKKALSSSDDEEKEEGEEDEDEEEEDDDDDVENDEEDENDDDEAEEEEEDCETKKRKSWVADILVSREENPSSEHNKEGELTLLHTALRFISSLDEELKNQNMEMSDFVSGIVRSCCKSKVPATVSHEDGPIHQALPPRSDIVRGVSDELIGAKFDDLFQKDNNVPVRLAFTSWLSKICSLRPFRDDQGRIKKFPKQDPLIVHVSVTIFEIMISLLNIKIPGVKVTKKMIETKNLMMPREIGVILERAIINAIRSKRSSYKRSERSGKKMVVSMEKDSDCDISEFDEDEELDNEMANDKTPEVSVYCNVIPIFFNYIYYVTFLLSLL